MYVIKCWEGFNHYYNDFFWFISSFHMSHYLTACGSLNLIFLINIHVKLEQVYLLYITIVIKYMLLTIISNC